MKKLIPLFILFLILSDTVSGQNILALKNTSRVKINYYPEGSIVSLGMDTIRITGRITSINDSLLIINNKIFVPVSKIDRIYEERWFAGFISAAAKLMGITYFGLTAVNRTLNKEYPIIDGETLLISAGLFGGAILLDQISERKIQIGKKWKLEVINPDLQVFK